MIITMYELLGMVKDGKAPKKIQIFDGTVFKYNEPSRHYYTENKNSLLKILDTYRGDVFDTEVEILEEEKKIPEKLTQFEAPFLKGDKPDIRFSLIIDQINEIIDYLKSKGDE